MEKSFKDLRLTCLEIAGTYVSGVVHFMNLRDEDYSQFTI